jgi:hypothetical protein
MTQREACATALCLTLKHTKLKESFSSLDPVRACLLLLHLQTRPRRQKDEKQTAHLQKEKTLLDSCPPIFRAAVVINSSQHTGPDSRLFTHRQS